MKIFVKKICNHLLKCADGPARSFYIYLRGYGGWKKLFSSIYFWIAIILAFIITIANHFIHETKWDWCVDAISIIPSILGFSLGGYAFLIGFGDEKFINIMRGKNNKDSISVYMHVNASFFHFILIQFLTLFWTVITKALNLTKIFPFDFVGIFLFVYSLLTIVSTAFCVLNLADWFDLMKDPDDESK